MFSSVSLLLFYHVLLKGPKHKIKLPIKKKKLTQIFVTNKTDLKM